VVQQKKVHFSPVDTKIDDDDGDNGDAADAKEEEDDEHRKKAALLDARQATPYVHKERSVRLSKVSTRATKKAVGDDIAEPAEPEPEKKSTTKEDPKESTASAGRKTKEGSKVGETGKSKNSKTSTTVPAGRETKEGLYIEDIVVGKGNTPKPGRPILVKYRGTLESGKVFDRSGKKPFRFVFGTGKVIRGWDLGLADMRVGGKRILRIPPPLAYGKESVGSIPPNSTLTFEIELIEAK